MKNDVGEDTKLWGCAMVDSSHTLGHLNLGVKLSENHGGPVLGHISYSRNLSKDRQPKIKEDQTCDVNNKECAIVAPAKQWAWTRRHQKYASLKFFGKRPRFKSIDALNFSMSYETWWGFSVNNLHLDRPPARNSDRFNFMSIIVPNFSIFDLLWWGSRDDLRTPHKEHWILMPHVLAANPAHVSWEIMEMCQAYQKMATMSS